MYLWYPNNHIKDIHPVLKEGLDEDGYIPFDGVYSFITIGMMIEFLFENEDRSKTLIEEDEIMFWQGDRSTEFDLNWYIQPLRLCDDLWEEVKETLEHE